MPIFGIEGKGTNWKSDILIRGTLLGLLFIFLNNISSQFFSVGVIPDFALGMDNTGRVIVSGFLAPVIEEIFFRGALLAVLLLAGLPFIWGAFVSSLAFAFYHITAYAGSFTGIGAISHALYGAFAFGMISCMFLRRKEWRNLAITITAHIMYNVAYIVGLVVATGG